MLYHDEDRDTLVFDPAAADMGPCVVTYDSNDQFNVWGDTDQETDAETFATFSKAMSSPAVKTVKAG